MRSAREEVQKIFSGLKVDPYETTLNLTRDQLDNMPVLGKLMKCLLKFTEIVCVYVAVCVFCGVFITQVWVLYHRPGSL